LNDFCSYQLTKFRAVYTVGLKVNRGPKVYRQSFTHDSITQQSSRLTFSNHACLHFADHA